MLIYILEDDDDIRELETYALKNSNFDVKGFSDANSLFKKVNEKVPDLFILDIMLPGEDGLSVLRKLRNKSSTSKVPVIMVTAKTSELDKVKGLDLGADDYLCKPFGIMELVSRVKARLRRYKKEAEGDISYNGITLSEDERAVYIDGKKCELTYKEFELLRLLLNRPGKVYSRDFILDSIWGYEYSGSSRTLDMHIKTLRQKLKDKGSLIKTVRNVGFKIDNVNNEEDWFGKKNYS